MLVCLPLIQYLVALLGAAYAVEHVAVALAVHAFLERLDVQAEVHLVGCHILAYGRQVVALQRVEEHEEAQYLVVSLPFGVVEPRIVLHILRKVYLFRYPEVVHSLPVPV